MIALEVLGGVNIADVVVDAIQLARKSRQVVEFYFCDKKVRVTNSDSVAAVVRRYYGSTRFQVKKAHRRARWYALDLRDLRDARLRLAQIGAANQ